MGNVKVQLRTDGGFKGMEHITTDATFNAWPVISKMSGHLMGYDISVDALEAAGAHDLDTLNASEVDNAGNLYFSVKQGEVVVCRT